MTNDNPLLDRVRKLLAKAEARGVTPAEAEALTAKAAELMARYGIDRALFAAQQPESDHPADRKVDVDNPCLGHRADRPCTRRCSCRCSWA
jgi:cytosine/adenosine deaminase-related metal-dependent hydrolase